MSQRLGRSHDAYREVSRNVMQNAIHNKDLVTVGWAGHFQFDVEIEVAAQNTQRARPLRASQKLPVPATVSEPHREVDDLSLPMQLCSCICGSRMCIELLSATKTPKLETATREVYCPKKCDLRCRSRCWSPRTCSCGPLSAAISRSASGNSTARAGTRDLMQLVDFIQTLAAQARKWLCPQH